MEINRGIPLTTSIEQLMEIKFGPQFVNTGIYNDIYDDDKVDNNGDENTSSKLRYESIQLPDCFRIDWDQFEKKDYEAPDISNLDKKK